MINKWYEDHGWKRSDTGKDRIQAIKDTAHTDVCIAFEWPDGDFCGNAIHPERSKAFGVEIKPAPTNAPNATAATCAASTIPPTKPAYAK